VVDFGERDAEKTKVTALMLSRFRGSALLSPAPLSVIGGKEQKVTKKRKGKTLSLRLQTKRIS